MPVNRYSEYKIAYFLSFTILFLQMIIVQQSNNMSNSYPKNILTYYFFIDYNVRKNYVLVNLILKSYLCYS